MSDSEREDEEIPMNEDDNRQGLILVVDAIQDDTESSSSSDEEEAEDSNDERGVTEYFDVEIPAQHRYLGESQEVSGRTILDENIIQDLPIISKSGVILMPGQTIPITFFHPSAISMIKHLLETTKTFGLIQTRSWLNSGNRNDMIKNAVGTTAEIYEFSEPTPSSLEVGLKIKARGRQRFKIVSADTQIDGNIVAAARILEEVELPNLLHEIQLPSRDRVKAQVFNSVEQSNLSQHVRKKDKSFNDVSVMTAWPKWVYKLYSAENLVERVHRQMKSLKLMSQREVTVPDDPVELSFWIATNFPLDDVHRLKLLEINCAIQRLRYELCLLEKYQILCCRNCGEEVARQEDVFSMSREGPQGTYVNPGGVVHETLTLETAQNLSLVGRSSTEYSWFPGYTWTICQCQSCDSHMGWKFKAVNKRLHPQKFWGLSRRSLRPKIEILPTMNMQDQIRPLI